MVGIGRTFPAFVVSANPSVIGRNKITGREREALRTRRGVREEPRRSGGGDELGLVARLRRRAREQHRERGRSNERPWVPPYLPTRTGKQP